MPKQRANGQGSVYPRKDGLWTAAATIDGKKLFCYGKTAEIAKGKLQAKLSKETVLPALPQVVKEEFYRIPKALFESQYKLNSDAKLLYSLLLDKGDGEISRDELREVLGVGKNTITKLFAKLKQCGLIKEKRQGLGKPNRIILGNLIP
jgi:biotin operon repressor